MSQPGTNSTEEFNTSLPEAWQAELARRAASAPSPVEERIAVIEDSLACFTYGWLTCIPFVGAAYLYPAVRRFVHARRRPVDWNPARGYLAAGMFLAGIGWLLTLAVWPRLAAGVLSMIDPHSDYMDEWPTVLANTVAFGSLPTLCAWSFALGVLWDWWAAPAHKRLRKLAITICYVGLWGWCLSLSPTRHKDHWMNGPGEPSFGSLAWWREADALFPMGGLFLAGWFFGGLLLVVRRAPLVVWLGWAAGLALLVASFLNW